MGAPNKSTVVPKHETFASYFNAQRNETFSFQLSFLKTFGYKSLIEFRNAKRYKAFVSDTKVSYLLQNFTENLINLDQNYVKIIIN